jgi:uncharacterized metal-binding protein YceD (DUF177 family)
MTPEFSRLVRLAELTTQERTYEVEAGAAEREALARRFGLETLSRLAASVRLKTEARARRIRLAAHFEADVVQTCVVTLEPVPAHVEGDFEVLYDRDAKPLAREVVMDSGEIDVVPLDGESLDIGEAIAEELSLTIDPYPRASGAEVDAVGPSPDVAHRPFEMLARLKSKH